MDHSQALLVGITIVGPVSFFAGILLALTVAASPSNHVLGKVLGCLISPIAAIVFGSRIGVAIYPEWHPWITTALFAGIPLLIFWGGLAVLTHEDFIEIVGKLIKALGRLGWRGMKRAYQTDLFGGDEPRVTKYRVPDED